MSITAMKQALEALYPISHNSTDDPRGQADIAITALRQAIAEAERQEPVAWMSDQDVGFKKSEFGNYPCVPLYTHPPKRKPLTDEQMNAIYRQSFGLIDSRLVGDQIKFVRAIEAAHGIKGEA